MVSILRAGGWRPGCWSPCFALCSRKWRRDGLACLLSAWPIMRGIAWRPLRFLHSPTPSIEERISESLWCSTVSAARGVKALNSGVLGFPASLCSGSLSTPFPKLGYPESLEMSRKVRMPPRYGSHKSHGGGESRFCDCTAGSVDCCIAHWHNAHQGTKCAIRRNSPLQTGRGFAACLGA